MATPVGHYLLGLTLAELAARDDTERRQAPWVLLPNVQHTRAPVISVHNALLMVREVLILAPLAGLVLTRRPSVRRRWRTATWLCAVWFLVAAGLSIASLG